MKGLLYFMLIALFPLVLPAQDSVQFARNSFSREGHTLNYRILYPLNYIPSKKYPVITFLHGSGERGSDNEAQLIHGGSFFTSDTNRNLVNAIVIFPQCPKDSAWSYLSVQKDTTSITGRAFLFNLSEKPTTSSRLVKLLLDSLVKTKVADKRKMYIGGLSLGGFGTFDMIERYPKYFAAAIAICGGGDTAFAPKIARHVSVWIFHGDRDLSVDTKYSRQYYYALERRKADVRYTEYPGVGHNSWDYAFKEKELLPWLLSKSKR